MRLEGSIEAIRHGDEEYEFLVELAE